MKTLKGSSYVHKKKRLENTLDTFAMYVHL